MEILLWQRKRDKKRFAGRKWLTVHKKKEIEMMFTEERILKEELRMYCWKVNR